MNDVGIVDVSPGDEAGSLERIRELVTETSLPSVALMVTAVPNERPLDDRLQDWVHRFALLQAALRELPVRVGILVQALIGHGDRNRIVGDPPYQTIVGADGTVCRESFCPLDVDFQAYTTRLVRALAETAPDFMMIDDDFRLASHEPAQKGCMCPLHLERFSRIVGRAVSREELLRLLSENDNAEVRDQWEQLKQDSLVELARVIRDAIDAVDDAIPGSFCCATFEAHLAPAITEVLAGHHESLVRINNAIYLENGHQDFPRRVTQTVHQIAQFSPETSVLTEADTFPHNRYSLSAKSHLAHIVATTLVGCRGGKHWYVKADEDGWRETAPFRRMLAGTRPFLSEVERIRDRVSWLGPTVVGRMTEILRKPWDRQAPSDFLSDDWGWRIFARMGFPFAVTPGADTDQSPRAMCRTAPLAYTNEELESFLAGPLLLDGEAAWHLCERGLGEHLGVTVRPSSAPCALEVMHVCPGSERREELDTWMIGGGRYDLAPEFDDVVIASSYATGSEAEPVLTGPGLTWCENERGGRVAVYGLSMDAPMDLVFFNRKRKIQLLETLTWLADGAPPVFVDTDLDAYVLHGRDTEDDAMEYMCLFNLNPDTVEDVRIALPGEQVTCVEKLAIGGGWEPVNAANAALRLRSSTSSRCELAGDFDGALVTCETDASTMEPVILRLNR